ncbi:hypothetical protein [Arcticibacter tournemirensis]
MEENYSGNCQKLKIEVFGGSWHSNSNGETTFYISNRDGLRVNEVRMGSAQGNRFTLQAYKNGTKIDFFLLTSDYSSFTVLSYFMGGLLEPGRFVNVTISDSIPTGTLIPLQIVPVMLTDDSGNIAIKTRTIDPAYSLSVGGAIRAKEVKVESGWTDYVFDPSYKLKPLKEVEAFIKINRHLPDLPTAKTVQSEGIEIGTANALLLQKIEELTLYLIQQKHTISDLESRLNIITDFIIPGKSN